jgi:hypothetical protein
MAYDPDQAIRDNMKTMLSLRAVAAQLEQLPLQCGEYYANGGPGVSQGIVGERFAGQGNARFAPLSKNYFDWKSGKSKDLNKQQKIRYGRGSRMIDVRTGSKMAKDSTGGMVSAARMTKILPILVLTGALRAAVTARNHKVTSLRGQGDVAWVTFVNLPEYALAHHDPKKAGRVRRSPVAPNFDDIKKVVEFARRHITALTARFNNGPVSFGDGQARIIR